MRNMGIGNFRQIIFVFCLFINALELVAQSNPSIDALGDGSQKIISDTAHHQTASLLKMKPSGNSQRMLRWHCLDSQGM